MKAKFGYALTYTLYTLGDWCSKVIERDCLYTEEGEPKGVGIVLAPVFMFLYQKLMSLSATTNDYFGLDFWFYPGTDESSDK